MLFRDNLNFVKWEDTQDTVHSTRPGGGEGMEPASDVQTFRGIFKHSTFNFITMENSTACYQNHLF